MTVAKMKSWVDRSFKEMAIQTWKLSELHSWLEPEVDTWPTRRCTVVGLLSWSAVVTKRHTWTCLLKGQSNE